MEQKTIDGNILISKYMDATIEEWYPKNTQYPDQSGLHASFRSQTDEEKKAGILTYPGNEKYHAVELLKYHSSWSWLMPVWFKIMAWGKNQHGIYWEQQIDATGVMITNGKQTPNVKLIRLAFNYGPPDMGDVWNITVEFIKWYNENKDKY